MRVELATTSLEFRKENVGRRCRAIYGALILGCLLGLKCVILHSEKLRIYFVIVEILPLFFSSLVSICQTSDHLNAMRLPIIFLVPFPRFPLFLLFRIIHSHGPWWSERRQTGQNLPVTSTPLRIHTACDDFLRIRSTNASKTPLPLHYERRSVLVAKTSRNNCALSLFLPIQLSCCHIWTSYAG